MKKTFSFVLALAAMMLTMVFAASCTKTDDVEHEYVDLGLPSGTLWATCNIGATTPEGYGDYFAWGETKAKSVYNWEKYKYAKGYFDVYPLLTKYCTDDSYGENGFVDNLTLLQPGDDAARANWAIGRVHFKNGVLAVQSFSTFKTGKASTKSAPITAVMGYR